MSCIKNCKCEECEHLQRGQIILVVDDRNPFQPKEKPYTNRFKCTYTGRYDMDTKSLKIGGFVDDVIYVSENKIALDYINKIK